MMLGEDPRLGFQKHDGTVGSTPVELDRDED